MYTYTTAELQAGGFVTEVRGIFTPHKTDARNSYLVFPISSK